MHHINAIGRVDVDTAIRSQLSLPKSSSKGRSIAIIDRYSNFGSSYIIGPKIKLINIVERTYIQKPGIRRNGYASDIGVIFNNDIFKITQLTSTSIKVKNEHIFHRIVAVPTKL